MLRSQRQGKSSKAPQADASSPDNPPTPTTSSGWFSKPSKWFHSNPSSSSSTSLAPGTKEVSRKRSLDIKRALAGGSSDQPPPDRSVTPQPSISQLSKPPSSASSSKFYLRRPTFSHPTPVPPKTSLPPPPIPTARSASSGHQPTFVPLAQDDGDADMDERLPVPASNLASTSRKPWSRSVDDLSKLLSKSNGGGAEGSSSGGGFWHQRLPGRGKGGSELPPAMSYKSSDSAAEAIPYPAPTVEGDSSARRPRRKTNSLAGHTLLASAAAAQQATARPEWAKEYDGVMRTKLSSPPDLGGGMATLKSSESTPMLSLIAGSPPNTSNSTGSRAIEKAAKPQEKHHRSHSHSLLGFGFGAGASQAVSKDEPTVAAHTFASSPPSSSTPMRKNGDRNATFNPEMATAWQSYSTAAAAEDRAATIGNPAISNPILTPSQASHIESQGLALSPTVRNGSTPPSPLPSPGLYPPGGSSVSTSVTSFATPATAHHHLPSSLTSASSFQLPSPVHSSVSPSTTFDLGRATKRASQVVARSGFLLKHPLPPSTSRSAANSPSIVQGAFKATPSPGHRGGADYFDSALSAIGSSPAPRGIDLTKGWKPYKVQLKGSKLCFYKPPSDRRAGIEALFPTGVVPEPIAATIPPVSPAGKQSSTQGRKRAYWGTSKHPELLLYPTPLDHNDPVRSRVQTGSMEAFAHELVFFTCFDLPDEPTGEDLQRLASSHASFVDTIAFAHRRLSTTTKFVAELLRCVQMAKNATGSLDPKELRTRALRIVARLVDTYLDNIKEEGQECRGAILEIVELVEENAENCEETSRILQTLRGGGEKAKCTITQVTDWSRAPPSRIPKSESGLGVNLNELQRGLNPALLLKMNAEDFAATLHAFHYDALRVASQQAACKDFLAAAEAPDDAKQRASHLSLFAFTPSRPHFLTLHILHHVIPQAIISNTLRASTPTGSNRSSSPSLSPNLSLARISSPVSIAPSPAHHRATIIQKWISIGEASRLRGDTAAFMAIAMAICSRAVARLMQTWRRVSEESRSIVSDVWVPILASLGFEDSDVAVIQSLSLPAEDQFSNSIPYLGSVLDDLHRYSHQLLADSAVPNRQVTVEPLFCATGPLYRALEVLAPLANSLPVSSSDVITELAAVFQDLSLRGQPGPNHTNGYITSSLANEPAVLGHFAETYWKRKPPSAAASSPLLPLLWPEPLPTISLVDRDALVETARDTMSRNISSNNLASTARGLDAAAKPIMGITASGGKRLVRTKSLPSVRSSISEGIPVTFDNVQQHRKAFFGALHGIDSLGESLIRVADGELVLKVAQSGSSGRQSRSRPASLIESTPVSRQPSLRDVTILNNTSKRNSVPLSFANDYSYRSRPSSARNSVLLSGNLEPLRVVVKSGSLDRLVDVLVSGLDGQSANVDDNGLSGQSRRRFTTDLQEFRSVFFATFRTFCSPLALFECLKKRYERAIHATESALQDLSVGSSNWLMQNTTSSTDVQWSTVRTLRLGVLGVIDFWLLRGGGPQDCLDDPALYIGLLSFLNELPLQALVTESDPPVQTDSPLSDLAPEIKRIAAVLVQKALRPALDTEMVSPSTILTEVSEAKDSSRLFGGSAEMQLDSLSALELVDLLDNVAATTYNKVTEMDLLKTVEVIELQSADKLGWYSTTTSSPLDDEVVIQDVYSHLSGYLGSPSARPGIDMPFIKSLPASVRTTFRAHSSLRRWLVLQIVGHGLGIPRRVARIKTLLEALEICRQRAHVVDAIWSSTRSAAGPELEPTMSTFVGRALTAALLSPESRAHAKAWHVVATDCGGSVDALSSMLPADLARDPSNNGCCTIDLGWLLERITEVICQVPDFVQESQHLVNFDKRRYVCNLVRNAPTLANFSRRVTSESERFGVRTLTSMEQSLFAPSRDLRSIRDEAYREAAAESQSAGGHTNRVARPFQRLVYQQQDKTRRDKVLRDRLSKEQRLERQRVDKREKDLNSLMKSSKASRSGGSRVTAVFKSLYVRPMSIVTGAPHTIRGEPSPGRSVSQLDFEPVSKPALVLSLVGARAQLLPSPLRSYTFTILADDGAAPLMVQASTVREANDWISAINRVGTNSAAKRSTFLATSAATEWVGEPGYIGSGGKGVYGVSLEVLLAAHTGADKNEMAIPSVAELLMTQIEKRGLSEIGLYRIPGSVSSINTLRDALNRGTPVDITEGGNYADIHIICGALKLWMRQLPEPVFPTAMYDKLIAAAQIDAYETRLYAIRELVWALPKPHFALLRRFVEHLDKVTDYEELNQMPPSSLAIVFAPNLLKPPIEDGGFAASMTNLGHAANLIKTILLSYHWIFYDEVDADADADGNPSAPVTPTTSSPMTGLGILNGEEKKEPTML